MAREVGQKVNRSKLSDVFGVSLPTVDLWVRSGCPGVKTGFGNGAKWEFNTADVAKWLQSRAVEDATGDDTADEAALKRRRLAVTLKADELDLSREMELVSTIEGFEKEWAKTFAMLRQRIMTVPARVALSLVGEKSEARIKEVLVDELTAALTAVADGDDEDDAEGDDE